MEISRFKVPESAVVSYPPPSRALDTKPALLWINLTQEIDPALSNQLLRFCDIRHLHPAVTHHYTPPTPDTLPDVLVFEYDYPDMDSLNILRETHRQHLHIPIIMFTLHHSEELAIWALRNQVSDYFYKPLDARQINDIGLSLQQWHRSIGKNPKTLGTAFLSNGYPDEVRFRHGTDRPFDPQLAFNYIEQHLSRKISEDTLAELFQLSRFQFSRQFKKASNMTFQNYLLARRIEKAKVLLSNPTSHVADVAFAVGFTDPAYFTRMFKRLTGLLPSEWK